jgi:hypothetical protein
VLPFRLSARGLTGFSTSLGKRGRDGVSLPT